VRWPAILRSLPLPALRCISVMPIVRSSAAPTRTPTGFCASTFRRAPICLVTAVSTRAGRTRTQSIASYPRRP
jgi:hypothetical protein